MAGWVKDHPFFCSKSIKESFRGVQRTNTKADQSSPSNYKVKNPRSSNSFPIRVHMGATSPYSVRIIQNISGRGGGGGGGKQVF
jgi:hypothetical protein